MTPEYPPFRIDTGEAEPGQIALFPATDARAKPVAGAREERWGAGRVIALVAGTIVTLLALALLAAGTTAVVYDQTQREGRYLMTGSETYATPTHAFVSQSYRLGTDGIPRGLIGTVRIRSVGARSLFVGIGPARAVEGYLAGVSREIGSTTGRPGEFRVRGGGSPRTAPTAQTFWAATAVGAGTQTVTWKAQSGNWRIVLMNADGSAGILVQVRAGATVPHLLSIGIGIIVAGALVLLVGAGIVFAAVRRRAA